MQNFVTKEKYHIGPMGDLQKKAKNQIFFEVSRNCISMVDSFFQMTKISRDFEVSGNRYIF